MDYDEARSEIIERIDAHPKDGSVTKVIGDLGLPDLATEVAGGHSRKRSLMLDGFRDTAKVHLYEQMEPPIEKAVIKDREAGIVPIFSSEDEEAPQRIYWVDRYTHFRTATVLGQMYMTGAPAVKLYKDSGVVELGFMDESSQVGVTFRKQSEKIGEDGAEKYLRQSRESHEEQPSMHRNVNVLCDGWERLFDETDIFS